MATITFTIFTPTLSVVRERKHPPLIARTTRWLRSSTVVKIDKSKRRNHKKALVDEMKNFVEVLVTFGSFVFQFRRIWRMDGDCVRNLQLNRYAFGRHCIPLVVSSRVFSWLEQWGHGEIGHSPNTVYISIMLRGGGSVAKSLVPDETSNLEVGLAKLWTMNDGYQIIKECKKRSRKQKQTSVKMR